LLHLLPKRFFDVYLRMVGKEWATGDYMHLLGWSDIRDLLRAVGVSNWLVHRNKLLGFTLDFVVLINGRGQRSGEEGAAGILDEGSERQIVAESQVAGANLAEVAVIYMRVPAAGQVKVKVSEK
jgi:hypothetical protein